MNFIEENSVDNLQISRFENHAIHIQGKTYQQNVLLSTNQIIHPCLGVELNSAKPSIEITDNLIETIISLKPEVLLIGTGESHIFIPPAILAGLYNLQIGVETMPTQPACYTFNILSSDMRQVVALLIP